LRFVCVNEAFARYIGCTVDSLVGKQPKDIPDFSMADSVEALCRRALETQLTPPDFEIISTRRSGARRILHVSMSPFSPIDATGHFLFINGREVSDFAMREDMLAQRMSEAADARPRPEPTLAFLLETLIERRAIRARKNVHYLTLRSWRASIRDWQIMALKALKARIPPAMPQAIAREIVSGPVLLVDDVSTSGAHIEEAVELLRPHANMVFAVAWISGDVA
jgi:hypothetical protein